MNPSRDDLDNRTPTQLRRMARTQRQLARRFQRWAVEAAQLAQSYEDLADAREQRRRGEEA